MPAVAAALPNIKSIERRNMKFWEDEAARNAIVATGRRRLLISGMLAEACVSFAVLSALANGYEVFVVADACGGPTPVSHDLALRRHDDAALGTRGDDGGREDVAAADGQGGHAQARHRAAQA